MKISTETVMSAEVERVIDVLAEQATVKNWHQHIRFQIIVRGVRDLAPLSPAIAPDSSDYPPELYFQGAQFQEDAEWCELSPEWVLDVLERENLLVNGRRVQYEFAEFHAA